MKKLKKNGFTLIEIIIALTILGIGLVSAMAYLPLALDATKKASNLTKASIVAGRIVEEIKAASYDDITDADAYDTSGSYIADSQYPGFEYEIGITSNVIGSRTVSKDITVNVRWQYKGKAETDTFNTKIPKYNPG